MRFNCRFDQQILLSRLHILMQDLEQALAEQFLKSIGADAARNALDSADH